MVAVAVGDMGVCPASANAAPIPNCTVDLFDVGRIGSGWCFLPVRWPSDSSRGGLFRLRALISVVPLLATVVTDDFRDVAASLGSG